MKITVTRAEGPTALCKTHKFDNFKDANMHFYKYADTFPTMGYDKHDVLIEFDNGDAMAFRLDAQHKDNPYYKNNDVARVAHDTLVYTAHVSEYVTEQQKKEASEMLRDHFNLRAKVWGFA